MKLKISRSFNKENYSLEEAGFAPASFTSTRFYNSSGKNAMSEMLGNQYFMARKYPEAEVELEPVAIKDASNKAVRRKLIICYTQTNKFQKALDCFYSLVKEDIKFILDADPIINDCPCEEILEKFDQLDYINDPFEKNLSLGILWLYCDAEKSMAYLENARRINPGNDKLNLSLRIIKSFLNKQNVDYQ